MTTGDIIITCPLCGETHYNVTGHNCKVLNKVVPGINLIDNRFNKYDDVINDLAKRINKLEEILLNRNE